MQEVYFLSPAYSVDISERVLALLKSMVVENSSASTALTCPTLVVSDKACPAVARRIYEHGEDLISLISTHRRLHMLYRK